MIKSTNMIIILWYLVLCTWGGFLLFFSPIIDYFWLIVIASYFVADAGSYVFHYIVDHFGCANKPGVVREFQNHHANPGYIAQRPLYEVLYPAIKIITPLMILLSPAVYLEWIPLQLSVVLFVLGCCWVYAQLFHRWSHIQNTGVIGLLQSLHLILPVEAHDQHHNYPFMDNFSVINGWSNKLFDWVKMPLIIDIVLSLFGIEKRSTLLEDMRTLQRKSSDFVVTIDVPSA